MDLFKAFDCLPHSLIEARLKAYGLSKNAINLISSYLADRKQCVQIGTSWSTFQNISKGVPQGSILGPLIFNIFLNDIFNFINEAKLFNYADDNILSHSHPDFATLIVVLERESAKFIEWFARNQMKANPDKFQALAVGESTFEKKPIFRIGEAQIGCETTVKLLGVDNRLSLKNLMNRFQIYVERHLNR